jgi:glutamine amidotransferase
VTLIAVLDYGIGNLRSAQKALQHVGADARLTADPALVADASAVVLPGVGAFGPCMDALGRTGLDQVVHDVVERGTPFLGICVGMQLLYDESEEAPGRAGLGILPGVVRRLPAGVKHPQMQWNVLDVVRPSPLFGGLPAEPWVYFVHSYAPDDADHAVAVCDYGGTVVAAVERDHVAAMQFHPEKSGTVGLKILDNFVRAVATAAV